jgi:Ca2+-binding RTX toxin-like protein
VTATDESGNERTVTRTYTVRDVTKPTVMISSPAAGALFDQHHVVEADFSCVDESGGSGVDTCVGSVADGQPLETSELGEHELSVTVTDHAGNSRTVTQTYTVGDVTEPTVTITSPPEGASFDRHEVVDAHFTCVDEAGGSGVDTCVGSVADGQPIGTGDLGEHEFSVTATDHAGNTRTVTHTYTVALPVCVGFAVTVDLEAGDQPTSGDDVILGTPGADTVRGLGGRDVICGRGGNDTFRGGAGLDRIFGGRGADVLSAGPGGGLLVGSWGDDRLLGGQHNDTLRGRAGADILIGGLGNDLVDGGDGRDACTSGPGHDHRIDCETSVRRGQAPRV